MGWQVSNGLHAPASECGASSLLPKRRALKLDKQTETIVEGDGERAIRTLIKTFPDYKDPESEAILRFAQSRGASEEI
jgi:hypothetical protein